MTPLYISFLDNDMKIKFIKKNISISTINMGAEANINLCMKIGRCHINCVNG